MDFTGKPMKGFLFVDAVAVSRKAALDKWVKLSLEHILSLPKKVPKRSTTPSALDASAEKEHMISVPVQIRSSRSSST